MKLARSLLFLRRSDLITLSTATYTSMRRPGLSLEYCLRDMLGRDKE